jgi:hypothetical protein
LTPRGDEIATLPVVAVAAEVVEEAKAADIERDFSRTSLDRLSPIAPLLPLRDGLVGPMAELIVVAVDGAEIPSSWTGVFVVIISFPPLLSLPSLPRSFAVGGGGGGTLPTTLSIECPDRATDSLCDPMCIIVERVEPYREISKLAPT